MLYITDETVMDAKVVCDKFFSPESEEYDKLRTYIMAVAEESVRRALGVASITEEPDCPPPGKPIRRVARMLATGRSM